MKGKKIAFVWYWGRASEIYDDWRDGLRAAMEEIAKTNQVSWFFDETVPNRQDDFDAIILWGDSNCRFINELSSYNCKKAICLTTNPSNADNLRIFDAVFCESDIVLQEALDQGLNAIKAFGTDTDFFRPSKVKKDIKYFYPATFSLWKKQSEIAHLGKKLTCIGTIQPDGQEEYQACVDAGVNLEIGYFPASKIRDYYRRAKRVIIPAVHGSERTVLEAMACDVFPEVTNAHINKKAASYLEEYSIWRDKNKYAGVREFVLQNYSHKIYAKQMLDALK